jgi:hypothetical protein
VSTQKPPPVAAAIAQAIAASFAPDQRTAAIDLVASYVGRERERMQRALLALADGDLRSLADMTKLAHSDYRDVLYWADYTGAKKLTSDVAREKLHEKFGKLGIAVPKGL